jgi:thiamine-phosphate pyrophosphorylase
MSDDSPRLYLLSPPLDRAEGFDDALSAALGAADVACVLLDLGQMGENEGARVATRLVGIAQSTGAAVVLTEPRAVGRAKADGLHVRAAGEALEPALEDAVSAMKPDRIVGAGGFRSRHDAMSAGEADVDYVLFGEPAPDGWTPPLDDLLDRVEWWAEIFNVPCVGYAPTLAAVEDIAAAGADFVALREAVWNDPRGAAAAMGEAMERLVAGAKVAKAKADAAKARPT